MSMLVVFCECYGWGDVSKVVMILLLCPYDEGADNDDDDHDFII